MDRPRSPCRPPTPNGKVASVSRPRSLHPLLRGSVAGPLAAGAAAPIAAAAMIVANRLTGVKAIIAMTETGATPRMMSRIRSGLPVFAFTPHARCQRKLAVYRGIQTVHFESANLPPAEINQRVVDVLLELEAVREGDKVILTKGDYVNVNGGTNTLKVVEVGSRIL